MLNKIKDFLVREIKYFEKKEVSELQEIIIYCNNAYYNKGEPIISDKEYDELFKKLKELENKFNLENKVTEKIGSEVKESSFEKVKHSRPMISLDNTYNEEDLNDFDERVKKNLLSSGEKNFQIFEKGGEEYVMEFKFDGLGVELVYEDGKLIQGITRGNGMEGEDITANIYEIQNIPKKINYLDRLEVRGEVILPISSFNQINKKRKELGENLFSNPRNAASGSLRVIDKTITRERKLKFFAYDLGDVIEFFDYLGEKQDRKYFNSIKKLDDLGFETSTYFEKCTGIKEIINKIDNFGDLKKTLDFDIDGLVIKVNNVDLWQSIGFTQHHPKYAIAYKFPAEIITTKLLSVEHSVGRTGTITPVANLEEVNIGGVIVKRATLHNYDEIKNLDVKIGDNVFVKRAGEVIPKIISVVKDERKGDEQSIFPPEFCPSCGTKVEKDDEKVRFYCPNFSACPDQIKEKLVFAVGKSALNIDGFGEKQVELFLREKFISSLIDIFSLKEKKEQILELDGFALKSVENLFDSIEKSKKITIQTFLMVLQIGGVGKKTSKEISKLFCSREDLINFSFTIEDLEQIKDIGGEISKNIINYFDKNKQYINDLEQIFEITYSEKQDKNLFTDKKYFGKKMCITGSFDIYKREDLIKILEENGGEFVGSVSKNTNFLLAGEKSGSKLKKAVELGIKVLTLDEFLENIKN